jgi:hypothetical protein
MLTESKTKPFRDEGLFLFVIIYFGKKPLNEFGHTLDRVTEFIVVAIYIS